MTPDDREEVKRIADIPAWMFPLSRQGTEIHHEILAKTGEDEWELGDIASRRLVTRLKARITALEKQVKATEQK
jgi:hypothetical protein